MAQTRPLPTLSRGFTRLGRFLAPYDVALIVWLRERETEARIGWFSMWRPVWVLETTVTSFLDRQFHFTAGQGHGDGSTPVNATTSTISAR